MDERRSITRQRVLKVGTIDLGGVAIDGIVRKRRPQRAEPDRNFRRVRPLWSQVTRFD
jgi:hypothetical protein